MGEAALGWTLYDLGTYPGAVLSDQPTEMVKVELYRLSDKDHVFSVLDPYEGYSLEEAHPTEFRHGRVPVSLNIGEVVNAWAYLYCQRIEGLKPN